MVKTYNYTYNGEQISFGIDTDTQVAACVHKGQKWLDANAHEVAWLMLSPYAFKVYDKYQRQAKGRFWVYSVADFGMSEDDFYNAIAELEANNFLEQVTITDEESGEVIYLDKIYNFYETRQHRKW